MSKRSPSILALPCIACEIERCIQPCRTEEHHLNLGGKAGQRRRGVHFSVPLCGHHHRNEPPNGMTKTQARLLYGPSLAGNSRAFRAKYGSDQVLLSKTDAKLARAA